MHNTPKENAEFKRQFATTNLRYLAGEPESGWKQEMIAKNRAAIEAAEAELAKLNQTES